MLLKPDQERIKNLLSETITLMCRNGLNYKTEFNIEALIGITVDKSDVFLISVKETIKSSMPASTSNTTVKDTSRCDTAESRMIARSEVSVERIEHISTDHQRSTQPAGGERCENDTATTRKKRKLESRKEEEYLSSGRSTEASDRSLVMSVAGNRSVHTPDTQLISAVSENVSVSKMKRVCKREIEPQCISLDSDEPDIVLERECTAEIGAGRDLLWNGDITGNVELVWNNRRDEMPMYGSESGMPLSHLDSFQIDSGSIWSNLTHNTAVASSETYDITRPPDLKPEQVQIAIEVLSISGSFVNIGSVKAVQHSLRRLSRPQLSDVLERMSVPANSPYCVGILFTAGTTRVFYKTPPELLAPEALTFYEINEDVYTNVYQAPVRVPHSVKDPAEWIKLLDTRNPYHVIQAQRLNLSNSRDSNDGMQSVGEILDSEVKVEEEKCSSDVDSARRGSAGISGGGSGHTSLVPLLNNGTDV